MFCWNIISFSVDATTAEHVSDEKEADRWEDGSGWWKNQTTDAFLSADATKKTNKMKRKVVMSQYEKTTTEREKLTLSLQPCPGMRCWPCPPLLGWLRSWRSVLGVSCPTESRAQQSKTLRHVSHSTHCTHLSASTRPAKRQRESTISVWQVTSHQTQDKTQTEL